MAIIIVIHDEVTSKTLMLIELATRLERAGHTVSLMSYVRKPDSASHFEHRQHRLCYSTQLASGSRLDKLHGLIFPTNRQKRMVSQLEVSEFNRSVADIEPDLFLIDIECHEFVVAAHATGVPVMTVSGFFCLWKQPGCPPLHFRTIPGRGFTGSRVGIELAWLYARLRKRARRWREYFRYGGADRESVLTHFARALAPTLRQDPYQWLIPFIYRDLPMLTLTLPELDWPHTKPANVFEGGPMLRLPLPRKQSDPGAGMDSVTSFLERTADRSQKLVYCAFGAYANDISLWRSLISVANERREWNFVFGLGGRVEPSALGMLPANVLALAWAPQPEILSLADCAVVHAGPSTLHECFYFRVPVLIYPFDSTDQWGTTARVESHGFGTIGDLDRDTPVRIGERIEKLLSDAEARARLAALSERLVFYAESDQAVRAVEDALERSPR